MHDPGMVYIITYAVLFAAVAAILYVAKRNLAKRPNEKQLTWKPIYGCLAGSALMTTGAVLKLTVWADFFDTHSIYAKAAGIGI